MPTIPVRDWVPPQAPSQSAWEANSSTTKDTKVVPNPLVNSTTTSTPSKAGGSEDTTKEDTTEDANKPSFLVRFLSLPPWYAQAISRPPTPPDIPESLFFLNWCFAFAILVYAFGVSATNFFGIRQVRVLPFCSYSAINVTDLVPNNIVNLVLAGTLSDCAFCSRNATLGCLRTQAESLITGLPVGSSPFNSNNNPFSCGRGPSPDGPGCDIHPIISSAQRQYGPCMQTYAFYLQGVYLWLAVTALGCFLTTLWLWYSESFQDIYESQFNPQVQTSSTSYSFVASGGGEGGEGEGGGEKGGDLKPSSPPTQQQPLYPGKAGTCCWLPPRSGVWRWLCCWPSPRRVGPAHCCAYPLSKRLPSILLVSVCLGVVIYLQTNLTTQIGIQWITGDCPDMVTVYLQNFDNIRATISMLQSALIAVTTERVFSLAGGKASMKTLVITGGAVLFNLIICKKNRQG